MEIVNQIPLKDFCQEHSQIKAADVLEVTQGAISQMLKAEREVYLYPAPVPKGFDWLEVKRKPRKKS